MYGRWGGGVNKKCLGCLNSIVLQTMSESPISMSYEDLSLFQSNSTIVEFQGKIETIILLWLSSNNLKGNSLS